MTDLEKINRPVFYENRTGCVATRYGKNTKYIFNGLLEGVTLITCFSFLDDNKNDIIAGFRVTKIHDTRRENN